MALHQGCMALHLVCSGHLQPYQDQESLAGKYRVRHQVCSALAWRQECQVHAASLARLPLDQLPLVLTVHVLGMVLLEVVPQAFWCPVVDIFLAFLVEVQQECLGHWV